MKEVFSDALRNNAEKISEYLHFGDINIKDERGMTLLHYACLGASNEVTSLLIENKIDINQLNDDGETPIFITVRNRLIGLTQLLINKGARLDLVNNHGESLLQTAVLQGSIPLFDLLLKHYDYDLTTTNLNHENILFYALRSKNKDLFFKIVELDPSLIDYKDYHNTNLLQLSIKYNNVSVFNYLKDKISLYARDNGSEDALMYMAKYANSYIVSEILKMHPIIEAKNMDDEDVLAVSYSNPFDIYHMIDLYKNSYDYVSYLRTYPIHVAIIRRDYLILEKYNYDQNKKDIYGTTIKELADIVDDKNIHKILDNKRFNNR